MKRRTFLLAGLSTGGALFVGWALLPARQRLVGHLLPDDGDDIRDAVALNGWLTIAPDDTVTVVVPKAEMGQGIHTALAMLVAEELDCDWQYVRVAPSPIDKIYGNVSAIVEGMPFAPDDHGVLERATKWMTAKTARELGVMMTGGSSSVRDCWLPMREAGASARASLIAAAAAQWNVSADSCTAAASVVKAPDGRTLRYGELAAKAVDHRPSRITLKPASSFTLLGKPMPRLDSLAKSNGTATFSIDVTLPGMLYAAVLMAPIGSDTVPTVADSVRAKALAMPGVKQIVSLQGSSFGDPPALAVIAASWWQAKKAVAALGAGVSAPTASNTSASNTSTSSIMALLRSTAATEGGVPFRWFGGAHDVLKTSERVIDAKYEAPYLAHATMEPMNATVLFANNRADLYTSTQVQGYARSAVAQVLGLSDTQVTLHERLLGGGFGRRLEVDYIAQAAAIAKSIPGTPVQLIWSREDDMRHDFYRPAAASWLRAGVDANGAITTFVSHSAGQAPFKAYSNRVNFLMTMYSPDRTTAEGTWDQPYAFPALHASHTEVDVHVPVGSWRAVGHSHQAFFVESFIDELAHAAKQDPAAYRATLLQSHPRALAVLQLAAAKGNWGTPIAPGNDGRPRARGVALHASFGTIVAQVAEVSISEDNRIRVHRVVAAVDCGFPVNPTAITQQVESGIIFGLSAALHGEITIDRGSVVQSNFHDAPTLRINECPVIETFIVPSMDVPSGIGEPALPPIAPAVANAVFALTGTRLRALPLRVPVPVTEAKS